MTKHSQSILSDKMNTDYYEVIIDIILSLIPHSFIWLTHTSKNERPPPKFARFPSK